MDIVGKIGAYFANHEAQMRLVMQHARGRQRVPTPKADATPELDDDPIDHASRLLDKCLDSFEASVAAPFEASVAAPLSARSPLVSPCHARPLAPPPPRPEVAPATTPPCKPKRLKRKKPKAPSAAKTAELAAIKQKLVDDAIAVTKERARRIQMDKELRLKAEAALAAEQQARREAQLLQIESIRRQAFRPVPAPASPNQLTSPRQPAPPRVLTDAWSERVPPRRHTILGLRKPVKQPTPSLATVKHNRSASLSHLAASMPPPNNPPSEAIRPTTPSPRIDPMTKFGPIQDHVPSATPFLDRLEHMERYRATKASEAAIEAKHRADVAAAQAAEQRRMDLACDAKAQQNLDLDRQRLALEAQKKALEASLQALHTESSQLRSERHKIAMERRVARRAAVNKSNNSDDVPASSSDVQGWVQDETDRANQAAKARAEAKRRVQMRRAPPASAGPETIDDTTGSSTPRPWQVSPLPQPRWDAAFFGYSSGSDTE
ncbi:hypothetical protein SPRG_14297 [Saprolegnia parasitica CBS 223.65]|uniref:Uncharacterized protein n=1 Tax=Saprolegnia parasitica (strain CBS 223.65) TaxID=695850 RepID=A0A067BS50_SAPPC|nr:hypothetical protein SPRG_14297 [Saprolegnia parasitica CBS 223.65]KDO19620.1 hypothetical protein SPRG_14297 [Saprolegnia parasitica CBS 223.65]|eukprot:XP_012209669.1 hypothetical protein SPRG_14297 [Saprolegnia parasitica CBS 223.65]